jgi:ABC-type multidrug transport system ATPase subunit
MTLLELKSISKSYANGFEALKKVSLSFKKGEILGLLGVNGSGKTTCSTILAGLHPPTSGDILFDGKSITRDVAKYRKHVGYCPQKPNLHDLLSVFDNIYRGGLYFGLSSKESKESTEYWIDRFGLKNYQNNKPPTLSGGYQQRANLARALVHNPSFIILDEPTVGLDPGIRKKLWDIILDLKKMNKSILLTTHYLEEADVLCDRVCILDKGKVLRLQTKEELKAEHHQAGLAEIFMKLTEEETQC